MKKVTNYLKNVGKSLGYASLDVLGDLAPASSEFITTNSELFKELAETVRDHKQLLRRTKDQFIRSKIYEAADVGFKALKEDIATGNFYNKQRKDALAARSVGLDDMGDFSDIEISFGDEGGSSDDFGSWDNLDAGDKGIIDSIEATSRANSAAISSTISRSTEYIVESQKAMHEFEMLQNLKTFGNMQSSLNTISENMANMLSFQTSVHKTHMENSKKFYEEITKLSRENNALIKEFVEMERNRYAKDSAAEKKNGADKITVNDILGSTGAPDLRKYLENVKKNVKTKISNSTGMLGMFNDGNVLLDLVASPLEYLPKWLIQESISTSLKKQIKNFDKALGNFMGALITKLNTAASGDGALSFIAQIFGVQNNMNRTLDTAKYEKGAVPWDGIARKSIVEVIPTYLRKILAALTGKNEHGYNYETGKFEDLAKLKESEDRRYDSAMRSKMGEFLDFMTDQLDTKLSIKDKEKKDKAKKSFFDATKKLVESGKLFDHNKKDMYDDDLGLDAEMYTLYTSAFKAMDRRMQLGFASAQAQTRQFFEEEARRRESFSDSIGFQLENGSDSSDFGRFKAKDFSKYVEKVQGGVGGGEVLISTKDRYGNSIFNYLHDTVTTLREGIKVVIVGNTAGGSAPSSSGKLGPRGGKATGASSIVDTILNRKDSYNTGYSESLSDAEKKEREQKSHSEREEKKMKKNGSYVLGYEDLLARADEFGYSQKDIIKLIKQHYRGGIKIDESMEESEKTKFEKLESYIHKRAKELDEQKQKKLGGDKKISKEEQSKGLIEELLQADNIFAKASIISDRFSKLTEKPLKIVSSILDKADQHMYEIIYGTEDKDNPDKPTGFMDALISGMKDIFGNFNKWLNEQILNPLSKKFKGIGDKVKSGFISFLDFMGIDHEAIGANIKEGVSGFKGRLKTDAKSAFNTGKQSFLEVFKPGFSKLTGKTTIDTVNNKIGSFDPSSDDSGKFFTSILAMFDAANVPIYRDDIEKGNMANIKAIVEGYSSSKKAREAKWLKTIQSHLPEIPKDGNDPYADIRSAIESGTPVGDIINMISGRDNVPADLANMARYAKLSSTKSNKDIASQIDAIIKSNATGREAKTSLFSRAGEELLSGMHKISEAIFGFDVNDPEGDKFKSKVSGFLKDFSVKFKDYAPDMASKGILTGLGFGALGIIGGPLAGLAIGAGVSLVKQSEKLQTMLFGEKYEADEGDYKAGQFKGSKLFSRKFMDGFNKYFPDMKKFGIAGGIASIIPFVPGGPVAGIIVGSAIGFAKNNEKIQDFLFGEERGIIGPDAKKKLDKYLPKALAGAAVGAGVGLFGPFGILGGAAVGAATGLLTTNEKFQEFFLGKKNKDGKYEGGVIGNAKSFIQKKIVDPLKYAMAPIGHELKNVGKNVLKMFSTAINDAFQFAVGQPLKEFINDKIIKPLSGFFTKVFGLLTKILGGIISSPVKMLTSISDSLRTKHIKRNDADYMSIAEQEDFIKRNPTKFLFTRFGGLAVRSLIGNIFDQDTPSRGEVPDSSTKMTFKTKLGNMIKNIGGLLSKRNKNRSKSDERIAKELGGEDTEGLESESAEGSVIEILKNGKKVKVKRTAKTKAEAKVNEMTEQLAERDKKIAELSEKVEKITNPSGAPGTGPLSPEELARIYRDNHRHIKNINDEVKGQLDGVGYNAERAANILANAFGDAPATGLKGARGNARRKGFFGKLMNFVMNPIKFLTGKGVELLIGKDGKGGIFGGLFAGIRGIFDNLASIITAPFKAVAAAANIFLKVLESVGPAIGQLMATAIEVGITTPLKVFSSVIVGISEGVGKAAGHLIEGLGALTGGVMDLVASIPTLVTGIVDLTAEFGKLTAKLLGGLAKLVTDGISLAAQGLGSLIFGPLKTMQLKMGVYVLGGKLDEVTLVKEVEHVTLVDKLIELEKISRVKILETVEKIINGGSKSGGASTGIFTEAGPVLTDTDAKGEPHIVPNQAGKTFMKDKIAERTFKFKALSALSNIERETTETSDNTSFLSKLKNGASSLLDLLPTILPFLPAIGLALNKILEFLGLTSPDGKDVNGNTSGNAGHVPRVLANILMRNKQTKAAAKFLTDTVGEKMERKATQSVLDSLGEKTAANVAKQVAEGSVDDVAKFSKNVADLLSHPSISKYVSKDMANALTEKLGVEIAKKSEKNIFKGVIAAAGKKILSLPFMIWDFSTGMTDAAFLFKASNPTWGMRLVAGIFKVLNSFLLFGMIPSDFLLPIIFDIIKPFLPETFVNDVETRQIAQEQARIQYNKEHGTNLSAAEYNDQANKTFGSKAIDFFRETSGSTGKPNQNRYAGAVAVNEFMTRPNATYTPPKSVMYGRGGNSEENGMSQFTYGQRFPFFSQKDRRWSGSQFNNRTDKTRQTIGDSGCGPTAESMALTAITGNPVMPTEASSFAIQGGFKEVNGGTKYNFFDAFAKRYGINTGQMDINMNGRTKSSIMQNIIQKLKNNIPVILMGKDGSGRSPFGKNPHYVLATGIDPSGNVIINNPERSAGGTIYPLSTVLSKAIRAIWHTNRLGKGYDPNALMSDKVLRAITTSDMVDSSDRTYGEEMSPDQQSLWEQVMNKYGISSSNDMLDQDLSTAFNGSDMVSGKLGIHGWFGQRLTDMARALGVKLETNSGYRSTAKQTLLWNERRRNHPNESEDQSNRWVARPGTSRHEAGLAIDLATMFYRKLTNATLKKFGLYKPLSWEDWHVEPIETKGLSTADLLSKYGRPGTAKSPFGNASASVGQSAPLSKNQFIQKLIPGAKEAFNQHEYLLPSITIAQAILESAWGKSGIGNNIFGIKAPLSWSGKRVKKFTHEQTRGGHEYGTYAWFKDYDSIGDAIKDHSKILVNGSSYDKFRKARNYVEAAKALQGTYATDNSYASKLISIIKANGLDKLDAKSSSGSYGMGSGPMTAPKYGMGPKITPNSVKAPKVTPIARPQYKPEARKVTPVKAAYHSSGTSSARGGNQLVIRFIELLAKIVDNTAAINKIASLLEAYLKVSIPENQRTAQALPIVLDKNAGNAQDSDLAELLRVMTELSRVS